MDPHIPSSRQKNLFVFQCPRSDAVVELVVLYIAQLHFKTKKRKREQEPSSKRYPFRYHLITIWTDNGGAKCFLASNDFNLIKHLQDFCWLSETLRLDELTERTVLI